MNLHNCRFELEKKILRNKSDCFCNFIIKVIDNVSNVVINEIYTTLNLQHGSIFDKYNLFINNIRNNKDSIFENTIMGNIHKISYYNENIIFKTELTGMGQNYTLIRIPISENILNILFEIEDFLNNFSIAGNKN